MANYTIKELYEAYLNDERPTPYAQTCFLGGYSWCFEPLTPEETDTRPEWVQEMANATYEPTFARKYGSWVYVHDSDDVYEALDHFQIDNVVYELTHRTSLTMTHKALISTYNPIHNYDRHEETKVVTDMTVGAKTQTAPDDSELFFNVGSGSTDTDGDVTTTSDISGNIGVTRSDEMVKAVVNTYSDPMFSMYDVLVSRLIGYSCILVD